MRRWLFPILYGEPPTPGINALVIIARHGERTTAIAAGILLSGAESPNLIAKAYVRQSIFPQDLGPMSPFRNQSLQA